MSKYKTLKYDRLVTKQPLIRHVRKGQNLIIKQLLIIKQIGCWTTTN